MRPLNWSWNVVLFNRIWPKTEKLKHGGDPTLYICLRTKIINGCGSFCFCSFFLFYCCFKVQCWRFRECVCMLCCCIVNQFAVTFFFFSFCLETLGWVRTIFSFLLPCVVHTKLVSFALAFVLFASEEEDSLEKMSRVKQNKSMQLFFATVFFILWFRPGFCTLVYMYSAQKGGRIELFSISIKRIRYLRTSQKDCALCDFFFKHSPTRR